MRKKRCAQTKTAKKRKKQAGRREKRETHHRGTPQSIPPTLLRSNKCCNTWGIYQSAIRTQSDRTSRRKKTKMSFSKLRKEFMARPRVEQLCTKHDLHTLGNNLMAVDFYEESFGEAMRVYAEKYQQTDSKHYKDEMADTIRHCANKAEKDEQSLQNMFWKRQLSKKFFTGGNPPCPLLTTLCMQRQPQEYCFECNSANTFEDWLEGHARAMRIMKTMLVGPHTSNCIHNSYKVAKEVVENFSDQTTNVQVKDLFEISKEAWKGKTRKHGWLNTQGMEAYLLNDEKTDTMVIQNFDLGTQYANIVKQCTNKGYDSWTPEEGWTKKISESMLTLIQAADELERGEPHNVQQLVIGAIDIAKFIGAHVGDYLEVNLKVDVDRLFQCAIPTEVTTLVLSGFGLIKGIEFANVLISGQTSLIESAFWHAQRQSRSQIRKSETITR